MLHNYDSQVRSVFYTTGFFQSHQQCIEENVFCVLSIAAV